MPTVLGRMFLKVNENVELYVHYVKLQVLSKEAFWIAAIIFMLLTCRTKRIQISDETMKELRERKERVLESLYGISHG